MHRISPCCPITSRRWAVPALAALLSAVGGCLGERSHPLRQSDLLPVANHAANEAGSLAARPWLRHAHEQIAPLLPGGNRPALLTEDLVDSGGRPVDVLRHFGRNRENLESLFFNLDGLSHTAQLAGSDDHSHHSLNWPGFEEVWAPVAEDLSLFGMLGLARDESGRPIDADCVIILPGLLGHNNILRTRDLGQALIQNGLHALAVELRGHGRTDGRYPDVFYNFGVLETADLVAVAEWLQDMPHIRRTGVVGFCWGANHAMLCAWYDGMGDRHPCISTAQRRYLPPRSDRRRFEAGVMAFSPVLRFEEIIDAVDRPRAPLAHPVLTALQATIAARVQYKEHDHHPAFDPTACIGSLRKLIDYEFARSRLNYPGAARDAIDALRFLPYKGKPDGDKLASARVPVLIVQGANDPLACAQDVADLLAQTPNPNVAAVVLPGGGHVGFAAYARAYYFNLILRFFGAATGPRPQDEPTATAGL